jgi:hypothetical protein
MTDQLLRTLLGDRSRAEGIDFELRSVNLRIEGNGQDAAPTAAYLAELPPIGEEPDSGIIEINARPVPLAP